MVAAVVQTLVLALVLSPALMATKASLATATSWPKPANYSAARAQCMPNDIGFGSFYRCLQYCQASVNHGVRTWISCSRSLRSIAALFHSCFRNVFLDAVRWPCSRHHASGHLHPPVSLVNLQCMLLILLETCHLNATRLSSEPSSAENADLPLFNATCFCANDSSIGAAQQMELTPRCIMCLHIFSLAMPTAELLTAAYEECLAPPLSLLPCPATCGDLTHNMTAWVLPCVTAAATDPARVRDCLCRDSLRVRIDDCRFCLLGWDGELDAQLGGLLDVCRGNYIHDRPALGGLTAGGPTGASGQKRTLLAEDLRASALAAVSAKIPPMRPYTTSLPTAVGPASSAGRAARVQVTLKRQFSLTAASSRETLPKYLVLSIVLSVLAGLMLTFLVVVGIKCVNLSSISHLPHLHWLSLMPSLKAGIACAA